MRVGRITDILMNLFWGEKGSFGRRNSLQISSGCNERSLQPLAQPLHPTQATFRAALSDTAGICCLIAACTGKAARRGSPSPPDSNISDSEPCTPRASEQGQRATKQTFSIKNPARPFKKHQLLALNCKLCGLQQKVYTKVKAKQGVLRNPALPRGHRLSLLSGSAAGRGRRHREMQGKLIFCRSSRGVITQLIRLRGS